MEFCKIKPKHILFNDLTPAQIGHLVIIQCLTASLDRMPTEDEILRFISKKQLEYIENHLKTRGKSVENVLNKVLEDVEDVAEMREYWKKIKRKQREKSELSSRTVQECPPTDKIREDKIREDIAITQPSAVEVIPLKTIAAKTINKKGGQQGEFVELWKTLYHQETGQTFVADVADYTIVANLLKTVPIDNINSKALMFFKMCSGSVEPMYGVNNMGDFTIKKFKSFYNRILIGG